MVILIIVTFVGFCLVNIHMLARLEDHIDIIEQNDNSNRNNMHAPPAAPSLRRMQSNSTTPHDGDKGPILEYFRLAGVELDEESIQLLPTWSQIQSLIGDKPMIYGLDKCEDYRNKVPPLQRMLGASGMFNSGTNLVTRLMKDNCVIPERYNKALQEVGQKKATKEMFGIRWQVPWGKHTPVKYKYDHTAPKNENITKDDVLPVVTIRNPYDWMVSMCNIAYTARWAHYEGHTEICPHLLHTRTKDKISLKVKLAEQWLQHDTLAHLWNDWYSQYSKDANFPFIMVRLEDLILRPYDSTKLICECAGGKIPPATHFTYAVESAKFGPGHGPKEERTGLVKAWQKYGKPMDVKAGFSDLDWMASKEFLDADLMQIMQYQFPPSDSEN